MDVGASLGEWLQSQIRPLYLALLAGGSVIFLLRRHANELLAFAALAVVVGTFVYAPQAWQAVAEFVAGLIVGGGQGGGGGGG